MIEMGYKIQKILELQKLNS